MTSTHPQTLRERILTVSDGAPVNTSTPVGPRIAAHVTESISADVRRVFSFSAPLQVQTLSNLIKPLQENARQLTETAAVLRSAFAGMEKDTHREIVALHREAARLTRARSSLVVRLWQLVDEAFFHRGTATTYLLVTAIQGDEESLSFWREEAADGNVFAAQVLALIDDLASFVEEFSEFLETVEEFFSRCPVIEDTHGHAPPIRRVLSGSIERSAP